MRRKKFRPKKARNGTETSTSVKERELRIPVEAEEDEEFEEDDGGLDAEDLLEEDQPGDDDDDIGEEGVDFVKATPEQELAGRLFQERQLRLQAMQQIANLESEIGRLRKEVADTRIQKLRDQAAALERANAQMFSDCGLSEGDQLKPTDDGFIVIPKGT